jgi:hypothetical protein
MRELVPREGGLRRITSACSGQICHAFCEAQNARHFALPLMRGG